MYLINYIYYKIVLGESKYFTCLLKIILSSHFLFNSDIIDINKILILFINSSIK